MALTKITPVPARVRWDRRYPAERGPRITLLVETDAGQASLVFDGRQRRWYVEALDQAA